MLNCAHNRSAAATTLLGTPAQDVSRHAILIMRPGALSERDGYTCFSSQLTIFIIRRGHGMKARVNQLALVYD